MKQIWIPRTGAPSVLELREAPDPTPGEGQVRVAVEAAGVNFADLMARMGVYPDAPPLPFVVGYEVAGTIDAVGKGVPESRVGEPVVGMTRFGGYSSSVVMDSLQAVKRPDGMDATTGAAIPVVGLTAWMMCEIFGRVRAGDRVLVHSAGGGVGLAALDLVKWRGGTAIGTASAGKHAFLTERGYDQLIDYTTTDFEDALKGQEGLDLILDPVGGDSWAKGLRLLRAGGRLVCFGFSAQATTNQRSVFASLQAAWQVPWLKVNPVTLMNENKGVMGVNMGHMWDEGERVTGWLAELLDLWAEGVFRPHVHATFPFEQAAEAHQLIHDRKNSGKVLLTP
ncbi:MAG: medium chain dehydrogenase/reductase family protein [Myxococcota bacterium]